MHLKHQYSIQIGGYYKSQAMNLSSQLQKIYKDFNKEIRRFQRELKETGDKIIEDASILITELKSERTKITKEFKEQEETQITAFNSEINRNNSNKEEANNVKLISDSGNNTNIDYIEKSLNELCEKLALINSFNKRIDNKVSEVENKSMENMENIILKVLALLLSLSEYKKEASERLVTSMELITFINYSNQLTETSATYLLEESDNNIEIANFLKSHLTRIVESEEIIDNDYFSNKSSAYFFKHNDSEIITHAIYTLKDLEEIFFLHTKYSKEIRQQMIKPLEGIIRVQSSLNSSIRISIKKVSLSFQKTENEYTSIYRTNSLSPAIQTPKKAKLKASQNKEINLLISDHLAKEKLYLSNITKVLAVIKELNLKNFKDIQDIQIKILNRSISSISFQKNSRCSSPSFMSEKNSIETLNILKDKGRNHFFSNFEGNNSSEEEEFNRRFSFGIKEAVISSYLCAFSDRILLQGKMYLTHSYLCFYSYFNSSTIIGNDTKIQLKLSDIISIEKKVNLFFFDNSIEIKTKNSSYFFTSFISRDDAYSIIHRLLPIQIKHISDYKFPLDFLVENRSSRIELQEILKKTIKNPASTMLPSAYFTDEVFNPPLSFDISIQKAYELLFSDKSHHFLKSYLEDAGDIEISITN